MADLSAGARRLWASLTFRLALAYAAVFTVSVAVLVGALYYASVWSPLRQVEAGLAREMAQILEGDPAPGALAAVLERRAATPSERRPFHLLLAPDGAVVSSNMPRWPRPLPAGAAWLRFEFERFETADEAEYEVLARAVPLPEGGHLLLGRDTEDLDEREELLGQAVAWGSAATILAGLLGGVLMTRAVGRRIEAVRRTAEQVMEGDLAQRIPRAGSGDDFDRLAETLNAMLARIETLIESVRRVSDSVAHELRTPLTHLRADLEELAEAGAADGHERQRLAGQALAGAERLQSTFDALIRIARVETGQLRAGFRAVDLSALLTDVAELYQPAAEEKGQALDADIAAGLEVEGDPDLLFQAVANLIDNAVKFGPAGSGVRLSAERDDGRIAVRVADSGPGIPEAARERVMERFYRLPSTDAPGLGLGLSFVRSVAEAHGGSILLAEGRPGTVATLTLPAELQRRARAE